MDSKNTGTIYGIIGVISFSLTLPATRMAVAHLNPAVVAFGRPVVAGILAAVLLIGTGQRPPERKYWKSFVLVILGAVFGVPLTFAWSMRSLPASHGAITLALLPVSTTLVATLRAGERPSTRFWIASMIGSAAVLLFARMAGAGRIQNADFMLFVSVLASGVAYAEGGRLSRVLPGWQVISWALVFGTPFLIVPAVWAVKEYGLTAPPSSWWGFLYVCVISQFIGMFAWYKGLALAGIARTGQLQLLQPFCTLFFSAVLLREIISFSMLLVAGVVVISVVASRNAFIDTKADHLGNSLPDDD